MRGEITFVNILLGVYIFNSASLYGPTTIKSLSDHDSLERAESHWSLKIQLMVNCLQRELKECRLPFSIKRSLPKMTHVYFVSDKMC